MPNKKFVADKKITAMTNFDEFLKSNMLYDKTHHTHISMCEPLGKLGISRSKFDTLFDLQYKHTQQGKLSGIAEAPIGYTMLRIDIDNKIECDYTTSRLDTLKQCFKFIPEKYKSVIIHDCDVIIDSEVLNKLQHNSLAITNYKLDGLKYGFIELDQNFKYLKGNEKETKTGHISIGAYSVEGKSFFDYLKTATEESLLAYYNQAECVNVVYSKKHTNLGDINSYMDNLWLL